MHSFRGLCSYGTLTRSTSCRWLGSSWLRPSWVRESESMWRSTAGSQPALCSAHTTFFFGFRKLPRVHESGHCTVQAGRQEQAGEAALHVFFLFITYNPDHFTRLTRVVAATSSTTRPDPTGCSGSRSHLAPPGTELLASRRQALLLNASIPPCRCHLFASRLALNLN